MFGKPKELQGGQPIPVFMTFWFLPHKKSMPRQTLPMPHPLALASKKNKSYKCSVQHWMMDTKMLKEVLHSQEPKILYHYKSPTLDTIHMQLNLLIFSPWPFKFHAPAAVREIFSLSAHYCTISLLDEKEVHYWDSTVPSVC